MIRLHGLFMLLVLAILLACGCERFRDQFIELDRIADATEHERHRRYIVKGHVLTDQVITYSWKTGARHREPSVTMHCSMVPLVDEGWTPNEPVAMWIDCPNRGNCNPSPTEWLKRLSVELGTGSIKVGVWWHLGWRHSPNRGETKWEKGIAMARERGIKTHPKAVIAYWPLR